MDLHIIDKAIKLDLRQFAAPTVWMRRDLFQLLVAVVLSQHTSDKNAMRAFENLERRLTAVTPERLASLPEGDLAEVIKTAGMQRARAKRLKALAASFLELEITPEKLAEMGVERARALLLSLPGVGPKTADVVLVNLGLPTFPVDTHIARIAKRWGVDGGYGAVSKWFMERVPPDKYLEVHLKLIQFGREICTARKPKCGVCPVSEKCPSRA